MKHLLTTLLLVLVSALTLSAQQDDSNVNPATDKGSVMIHLQAPLSNVFPEYAQTGFLLRSADGATIWNIGANGGYFVSDNFALV